MGKLSETRRQVIELVTKERDCFEEYKSPPLPRPEIYCTASVEKLSFERMYVCETSRAYDVEITVKAAVYGCPDGDPEKLYDMADSRIVNTFLRSGYSVKSMRAGSVYQDKKIGRMVLEMEVVLMARTAEAVA